MLEHIQCAGVALVHEDKIFLIHPTGFDAKKSWGIPKGRIEFDETPEEAAVREFREETGIKLTSGTNFLCMSGYTGTHRYPGKDVHVFVSEGTGEEEFISCNEIDYGELKGQPENDQGRWFSLDEAKEYVMKSQEVIISSLTRRKGKCEH